MGHVLRLTRRLAAGVLMVVAGASALAQTPKPAAPPLAARAKPVPAAAVARPRPAASAPAEAAAGFQIAPAPAWVLPVAPDGSIVLPSAPVHVLVLDRQSRLGAGGSHQYMRSLRQINEPAGLGEASQLQVSFDPQYQRLVVHQIVVWRGEQRIDKLERRHVRLYQRETQLERQMLDGRMTASIVLDDVRVGDRVEWAVSVIGDNPVFEGRFVDIDAAMAQSGPVALYQYRLLAPEARTVHHRFGDVGFETSSAVHDGMRETLFRRRNVAQYVADPQAPSWNWLPGMLQLSEFADWADVARWAEALFKEATVPGAEVQARAAVIRQQAQTPADRLRLALDLVQTEVRYFGTEIGAASHRPALSEKVLQQRFGDCKDKVALLVALLRALDIEATPVLVSNGLRRGAAGMLPSPLAFDHAIARVQIDGKPLWLDGTRSLQSGPAALRQSQGLGSGLPADAGVGALVALPGTADVLRVETVDTLRFAKLGEPASLEARHVFHGEMAEWVRGMLAARPRAEFDRLMAGEYTRLYNGAVPEGAVDVEQDNDHNALKVTVRYKLAAYWKLSDKGMLVGEAPLIDLIQALRLPDQTPRTRALRIAMPGIYRHAVVAQFADDVFPKEMRDRFDDSNEFFELHTQVEGTRNSARVEGEVLQLGDTVEPADWTRYRDTLNKMWPQLSRTLIVSPIDEARGKWLSSEVKVLRDKAARGQIAGITMAQLGALITTTVAKAQLDSDRLAPPQRAQVQLLRAATLDMLGQHAEARRDYQAVLALAPDNADAHAHLAMNALKQGEDVAAIEHANQALRLAPRNVLARHAHGYASYYREDYTQARDDMNELLKGRSEAERGQAGLWLYLATRRLGGDGASALKSVPPGGTRPAWPYPVQQLYEGNLSFDAALAQAGAEAVAKKQRETELYFFAAHKLLLDGDAALARRYLQKAVDLGVVEAKEYMLARRDLARLDRQ